MRRRFKIFGFGVTAMLLLGVAWKSFGPEFAIWDVWAARTNPHNFIAVNYVWLETNVIVPNHASTRWLDSDTIYFDGFEDPESVALARANRRHIKMAIYRWRVGKSAQIYTTDWDGRVLCANLGFIEYSVWKKELPDGGIARLLRYGRPGQEKPVLLKFYHRRAPGTTSKGRGFRCHKSFRPDMEGKNWAELLPDHGYLQQGMLSDRKNQSRRLVLYQPDRPKGIELPIPKEEINLSCIRYFQFIDAYLLWSCIGAYTPSVTLKWKQDNCLPYWFVWPDGRTKRDCIPSGPWTGHNIRIIPTNIGTMFISSHRDRKHAGGYLISNGTVGRFLGGYLWRPEVSPDGCRVVFVHKKRSNDGSEIGAGAGHRARVIDFCDLDNINMNSGKWENGNNVR